MGILRVRDKSNDEIISVGEIEDLLVNGQPINAIPTEVNITKLQNQKAIGCLKEVKEDLLDISNGYWKCFAKNGQQYMTSDDLEECLKEYIDNKIKELEGE